MKKIFLLTLGLALIAVSAGAGPIDFRDAAFAPAMNQTTFSITEDGFGLLFSAEPSGAKLWWDSADGFGVQGPFGYEPDEIETGEILRLDFVNPKPVMLKSIHITDLFSEFGYLEIGRIQVDTGEPIIIQGIELFGSSNGELMVDVNLPASFIRFTAPGLAFGGENHEFSVGGINIAKVPLPPAMLLLGSGVLGIIAVRRKVRR